jgi:pyruvate dehydrogenase E2 component (dihydrolipoamide acetyltransferase)
MPTKSEPRPGGTLEPSTMPFSVVMPALEMAQETGKLLAWRKKEGDRVAKGEPLLEIETDKAVVEIEAPADGVLTGISASEGAEIPVGQTIGWIVAPGEQLPIDGSSATVGAGARASSHAKTGQERAGSATAPMPASVVPASAARISPKARRLARELGVDIVGLHGSGPGGEILASDVQAAQARATAAPVGPLGAEATGRTDAPKEVAPTQNVEVPSSVGRIMAERTTHSWTTVPHFFLSRDVDATGLNQYRDRIAPDIERTHNIRISHTDLLAALVARVLVRHPRLNASWIENSIRLHPHVKLAIAIAVDGGVVAAVIREAYRASLADIAQQRIELTERARNAKLRPADIAHATFTISNLGMYKVDQFNAIITPPQAAILAVGAIRNRVVAVNGNPAVRAMMTLTISCDHRVVDGARAAMFLNDLAEALEQPATLLQ